MPDINTQSDSEEEPEVYIQTRLRPRNKKVVYRDDSQPFDEALELKEDDLDRKKNPTFIAGQAEKKRQKKIREKRLRKH